MCLTSPSFPILGPTRKTYLCVCRDYSVILKLFKGNFLVGWREELLGKALAVQAR